MGADDSGERVKSGACSTLNQVETDECEGEVGSPEVDQAEQGDAVGVVRQLARGDFNSNGRTGS
jgi:hypothetical protein